MELGDTGNNLHACVSHTLAMEADLTATANDQTSGGSSHCVLCKL